VSDVDVGALILALEHMGDKASDGARAAAKAMAEGEQEVMQAMLSLTSHPSGTATPAPPGSPPSRVSGALEASARAREPFPVGPARWEAHTAATTPYARIHEFGGRTGRGHRTVLPARPYVRPSFEGFVATGGAARLGREAFAREVGLA
jgi:hypothetical protein